MTLFYAGAAAATLTIADILARLDLGLTKSAGNPIIAVGSGGSWDDTQVREFRVLIDDDTGEPVEQSDGLWGYYGGYPDLTQTDPIKIGLAKSTDNGLSWTKYGSNPVASPDASGWNATHIAQPSVVKISSSSYVMMAQGFNTTTPSIGCLTSTDGLTWTDAGQKLVMGDFSESGTAMESIGVPTLIKRAAGDWLCLVECLKTGVTNGWRIFGATASSPTGTWTPLNSGAPLMAPTGSGWESVGVANPQIIQVSSGDYGMLYNGITGSSIWKAGFAYSSDLLSWTRYTGNPILSPGSGGAWDDLHIEAGFLYKEPGSGLVRIHYNGFKASTGASQAGYASA